MVWGCLAVESAPCQMLINYWDCFGDMEYCSTSIKGRLSRSIAQWHVAMIRYNFCVYVRRDFMWMWLCREFTSADLLLFKHKTVLQRVYFGCQHMFVWAGISWHHIWAVCSFLHKKKTKNTRLVRVYMHLSVIPLHSQPFRPNKQ